MNHNLMPLNQLPIGKMGAVKQLRSNGNSRRRMLDLGLILDTQVEALQSSPAGDPVAYRIRGAVIALRAEESSKIIIEII